MLIAHTQQRSERNEVKNAATSHQIERRQSVDDLRREMSVRVFAVTRNVAYNIIVLITACNCEYAQGTCVRTRSPAFNARFFGIVLLITTVCCTEISMSTGKFCCFLNVCTGMFFYSALN